jgi:hypothetical protein
MPKVRVCGAPTFIAVGHRKSCHALLGRTAANLIDGPAQNMRPAKCGGAGGSVRLAYVLDAPASSK